MTRKFLLNNGNWGAKILCGVGLPKPVCEELGCDCRGNYKSASRERHSYDFQDEELIQAFERWLEEGENLNEKLEETTFRLVEIEGEITDWKIEGYPGELQYLIYVKNGLIYFAHVN